MDGLVAFDLTSKDLSPKPALAQSWEVSEDGLTWTFYLRKDVVWSDDAPFTSQHVLDAFHRILNPETAALAVDNLFVIQNAVEFNSGKIKNFKHVGVSKLDDYKIQFRLKAPVAFFPLIMAHHTTFPIRLDIIKKYGDRWIEPENIVTLGPYRLIHWHHDSRLIFKRNKTYWGVKPKVPYLIFYIVDRSSTQLRMFERGKIDFIKDLPSSEIARLSQTKEYNRSAALRLYYYAFKTNKKPFDNVYLRQALAYAIDRHEVVKVLGSGQESLYSWIPHGLTGHSDTIGPRFDVVKARELFKSSGYDSQKDPIKITLGFNSDEKHKRVAENIQSQLKRNLGLKVELLSEEWKTFLSGLRGTSAYSIFRLGWVADYPDPHTFMAIMKSHAPNNRTGWRNSRYDKLVDRGVAETDFKKRIQIYNQAQKILLQDEAPVIPLFTEVNQVLVSQRIQGFHPNRLDLYHFHLMEIRK